MCNSAYLSFACVMWIAGIQSMNVYGQQSGGSEFRDSSVFEDPMTIAAGYTGTFNAGYSWFVSINSSGNASVHIQISNISVTSEFKVADSIIDEIKQAVSVPDFFSGPTSYGDVVLDGRTQSLTVVVGQESRSVRIEQIADYVNTQKNTEKETKELRDLSNLLRIMNCCRDCFSHPLAFESTTVNQRYITIIDEIVRERDMHTMPAASVTKP